jgi:signal peptidase I
MISRNRIKQAEELLATAHKVDRYRRDLMKTEVLESLRTTANELAEQLREGRKKTDAVRFEKNFTQLESLLREHGGTFYPKTFLAENVEVLLVAAIIVLGIRAFFFQPFIIPTNSMYPSYSGMRGYTYSAESPAPSQLERGFRLLTRGARHRSITAPVGGTIELPVFSHAPDSPDRALSGRGFFRFSEVRGRKWFGLLPATLREYTLFVNGRPASFRVPLDFNADDVIFETFFPDVEDWRSFVGGLVRQGVINPGERDPRIPIPGRVAAGDPILQFDIELGDALFVDRFTYHFRAPRIGDPIVFRTREIEGMRGPGGAINDQYYIKRLAGVGGEILSIKDYALLVNGELRDEVHAFRANAAREGSFPGYRNVGVLDEGKQFRVLEGFMFALGDNSADSSDSRYWGPLPENAVIGRALFIYYPFTRRWGVAD